MRLFCEAISPAYAAREFENIVEYMTGYRPSNCSPEEKPLLADAPCVAICYEGPEAVRKIRDRLGETDPHKARPGSVRREFGTSIMINAAHASDSPASALREMDIIDFKTNDFSPLIRKYCHE